MKVLLIASLHESVLPEHVAQYMEAQATAVWRAYSNGILREMYIWPRDGQPGGAVLIYEVEHVQEAQAHARSLPVVQAGLASLALYVLEPYRSLATLFTLQPDALRDT